MRFKPIVIRCYADLRAEVEKFGPVGEAQQEIIDKAFTRGFSLRRCVDEGHAHWYDPILQGWRIWRTREGWQAAELHGRTYSKHMHAPFARPATLDEAIDYVEQQCKLKQQNY